VGFICRTFDGMLNSENESGRPNYNRLLKEGENHPIEAIGNTLRSMMTPLFKRRLVDKTKN